MAPLAILVEFTVKPDAVGRFRELITTNATRSLSSGTSALSGGSTINQLSQPLNLGVTQTLQTGTRYSISFSDFKTSTNSAFATINPTFSSNLNLSFSQPLLQGRGAYVTRLPIMIAGDEVSRRPTADPVRGPRRKPQDDPAGQDRPQERRSHRPPGRSAPCGED